MNDNGNTSPVYTLDAIGHIVEFMDMHASRYNVKGNMWGMEQWTRDSKGRVIIIDNNQRVNHYGVWFDAVEPTTGVYNMVDYAQFVSDCDQSGDSVDLDYEAWLEDHDCETPEDCCCEYFSDCAGTTLIGGWVKGEDGKYEPDKSSEFSAIVNETTIQVVWSIYTGRGGLCSPCYPGQVDADSEGVFKFYAMPPDAQY